MTQNVGTYDEAVTGSKQIFFFIFFTFERNTTNYRGTLVKNAKKVKNQPTLVYTQQKFVILGRFLGQ
jgi:hypothetical protein